MKPETVIEYSKNMGAVDRSDSMISFVKSIRKTMWWYKKVFFHIVDLCMLNAYYTYKETTGKQVSLGSFQLEVIRQLISKHCRHTPKVRQLKRTHDNVPFRMSGKNGHFLTECDKLFITKRRLCVICLASKKRKNSAFACETCKVALCPRTCFKTYHTKLHI